MSYGHRKIFSDATEITAVNVIEEVTAAYWVHSENRNGISELYRHYRNKTAIENKTKKVSENINNKAGKARYLEVTNFYKGYIFGELILRRNAILWTRSPLWSIAQKSKII